MKVPFPEKFQYAQNLGNGSKEAVDRVNKWQQSHGGSVEHLPLDQIRTEVAKVLRKDK
jgi:hypothetical protein